MGHGRSVILLAPVTAVIGVGAETLASGSTGARLADWLVGVAFAVAAALIAGRSTFDGAICLCVAATWYAGSLASAGGWPGHVGTAAVLCYRAPVIALLCAALARPFAISVTILVGAAVLAPASVAGPVTVAAAAAVAAAHFPSRRPAPADRRRSGRRTGVAAAILAVVWMASMLAVVAPEASGLLLAAVLVMIAALAVTTGGDSPVTAALSDLVVDLGSAEPVPNPVAAIVGAALGCPGLIVLHRPSGSAWVDELGNITAPPRPGSVLVASADGAAAALVPPEPVRLDSPLAAAAAQATLIALTRAALARRSRARADEARAAGMRLFDVGDRERAGIHARLRTGPLARLLEVRRLLDQAPPPLADLLSADVDRTVADLERLAHGLSPAGLFDQPLPVVLGRLAGPSADVVVVGTWTVLDAGQRALAYFFCAETIANALRHAPQTVARVRVEAGDGRLHLEATDGGPGGASIRDGHGLQNLSDRAAALGGALQVSSPSGGPTSITVTVPTPTPALTIATPHGRSA